MSKYNSTRLSPFKTTVTTKKYNKYPKKVQEEAIAELEQRKKIITQQQVPIINPVFNLLPKI